MADKTTGELQQELMEQPNIKAYLSDNQSFFTEMGLLELLETLQKRSKLTKAEIARKSGMSDVYLYQVLSGRRNPSRDRLLSLCVGLGASLEETQQVLRQGGWAQLYPRLRRDAIIIHGLIHHHELSKINDTLFAENEKTLS